MRDVGAVHAVFFGVGHTALRIHAAVIQNKRDRRALVLLRAYERSVVADDEKAIFHLRLVHLPEQRRDEAAVEPFDGLDLILEVARMRALVRRFQMHEHEIVGVDHLPRGFGLAPRCWCRSHRSRPQHRPCQRPHIAPSPLTTGTAATTAPLLP